MKTETQIRKLRDIAETSIKNAAAHGANGDVIFMAPLKVVCDWVLDNPTYGSQKIDELIKTIEAATKHIVN